MLRTVLEFLAEELQGFILRREPAVFQNELKVLPASLMKPDGSFAIKGSQGGETFKIIVTLVNMDVDRVSDSQQYYKKLPDRVQYHQPPVHLNLYILFTALADNYSSELRLLSHVVAFFQGNPLFDATRFPQLNVKVEADKPWQRVERFSATLHTMSFEQQNNLWATIGARYMPSVLYQVRTITVTDIEPQMEAPPIKEITITTG